MGGFGQEAVSKATLQRSFTLKRKRNGVVAGRGYGTGKVLQFYQVGEILTAHLSAGNDSTENNSSATQEWVYDLEHYLGGGERDWAPVHSGRDRKRSVMTTRVRQGCGRRGPCAGGGPDVHSLLLRWTLAGSWCIWQTEPPFAGLCPTCTCAVCESPPLCPSSLRHTSPGAVPWPGLILSNLFKEILPFCPFCNLKDLGSHRIQ